MDSKEIGMSREELEEIAAQISGNAILVAEPAQDKRRCENCGWFDGEHCNHKCEGRSEWKPAQDDGKAKVCVWYPQESDDFDEYHYESDCGMGFHFDQPDALEDGKFHYCPKCGKKIEEAKE